MSQIIVTAVFMMAALALALYLSRRRSRRS